MSKIEVSSIRNVKLKVEIWADIVCPWCYIGKRRFEQALAQFEHSKNIEIEWKSYQLSPNGNPKPGKSIYQSLADKKGWTLDYTKQVHEHVTSQAKEVGLTYNFDDVVVANTFDAHRLMQHSRKRGLGQIAEEHLFKAYFTEGRNIADHQTLIQIGTEIGLESIEVSQMLSGNECSEDVSRDIYEAHQIGVQGVPYFLINETYAVSGAQQPETFLGLLRKAWAG